MRTVTVDESPGAVPAVPENVGLAMFRKLPFAGAVSVTTGGVVSVVVWTTSCGLFVASRLAKVTSEPPVVTARLKVPLPVTRDVTSTLTHCPDVIAPDDPSTAAANAGALLYVMPRSVQLDDDTACAAMPEVDDAFARRRRVAEETAPVRPVTLNRRYDRKIGDPWARSVVAVPKFVPELDELT
jgi:hypothetical protein